MTGIVTRTDSRCQFRARSRQPGNPGTLAHPLHCMGAMTRTLDLAAALASPCGLPSDTYGLEDVVKAPTCTEVVTPSEWTLDDLLPQDRECEVDGVDTEDCHTVLEPSLCGYCDTVLRMVWEAL